MFETLCNFVNLTNPVWIRHLLGLKRQQLSHIEDGQTAIILLVVDRYIFCDFNSRTVKVRSDDLGDYLDDAIFAVRRSNSFQGDFAMVLGLDSQTDENAFEPAEYLNKR